MKPLTKFIIAKMIPFILLSASLIISKHEFASPLIQTFAILFVSELFFFNSLNIMDEENRKKKEQTAKSKEMEK